MTSVKIIRVRRVAETGRVYIQFADKTGLEFGSRAEMLDWARDVDGPEIALLLKRLLVRWWLHRNPTGDDPSLVEQKTMECDLSAAAAAPLRVI